MLNDRVSSSSDSSPFFRSRISDGGSSDDEFIRKIAQVESGDDGLGDQNARSEPPDFVYEKRSATDDELSYSNRTSLKTELSLDFSESQSIDQSMSENVRVGAKETDVSVKSPPPESFLSNISSELSLTVMNSHSPSKSDYSTGISENDLDHSPSSKSDETASVSSAVPQTSPLPRSPVNVPPAKNPMLLTGCQWGKERTVEVHRVPNKSIGISIVGGKIDMFNLTTNSPISGIFIKNVLPDTPAGASGALKTGDRIIEVSISNYFRIIF